MLQARVMQEPIHLYSSPFNISSIIYLVLLLLTTSKRVSKLVFHEVRDQCLHQYHSSLGVKSAADREISLMRCISRSKSLKYCVGPRNLGIDQQLHGGGSCILL